MANSSLFFDVDSLSTTCLCNEDKLLVNKKMAIFEYIWEVVNRSYEQSNAALKGAELLAVLLHAKRRDTFRVRQV